jgi:hypothetical protein
MHLVVVIGTEHALHLDGNEYPVPPKDDIERRAPFGHGLFE